MKTKKAKKVLKSQKPQTEASLMKAIKSLGSTPSEISAQLIKMGFEKSDQTSSSNCPVCTYLKKLGVKSPYVTTEWIQLNEDDPCSPRIELDDPELSGMAQFQDLAGQGKLACFAGANIDLLLDR